MRLSLLPKIADPTITSGRNVSTERERSGLSTIMRITPPMRVIAWDSALATDPETVAWTTAASEVSREVISPVRRPSKNGTGSRTMRSYTERRRSATTPSPTTESP